MTLLYVSVHSGLQFDETLLFCDLGEDVEVGGPDGRRPKETGDRPTVGRFVSWSEETLPRYDTIVVMHDIDALVRICKARRPGQRIIWRTIGQSSPHHERTVRKQCPGVEIVRYSPRERSIEGFAGESALIRFYKDSAAFDGWTGGDRRVMVVRNNFLKRGFADDVLIAQALDGLPWRLFGVGNDAHPQAVGSVSYPELIDAMRRCDVFFSTHSVPASYTLNLIEAMMVGAPVVALAREAVGAVSGDAQMNALGRSLYELDTIIQNGRNGFLVRDAQEARAVVERLLADAELRQRIGAAGRETAIRLFDRPNIARQWKRFLEGGPVLDWRRSLGLWGLYGFANRIASV